MLAQASQCLMNEIVDGRGLQEVEGGPARWCLFSGAEVEMVPSPFPLS